MLGWEYPPEITGGLAIACRGLARALVRRGHSVDFFLPRYNNTPAFDEGVRVLSPTAEQLSVEEMVLYREQLQTISEGSLSGAYAQPEGSPQTSAEELVRAAIENRSVGALLQGGYGDHMFQEIFSFALLARLYAAREAYDIIHAHDWMTFPAGEAAAAATGRPLLIHVHATEFDRSGENVNSLIYDIERHAAHAAAASAAVSNYTRSILIRRYGAAAERVFAVHNAVESEEEHPLPPEVRGIKEPTVLFLGRITFQKGPEYFVRAARRVIDQIGGVRFVMVGTGDMYHRMIELAADLGIGRYFHYTGFLNREQVRRVFALSDLYVMPSVSEPFGISPLEAMLQGVPTIVSKQSGVSEIIENCIKVDFWDVDEMARSIIAVLSDSAERNRLREQGKQEAENLSWDLAAERLETIYDRADDFTAGRS
ncbi:MAG: glycosyltransferase family 4 protein [Leptospirales bacterium]|nr:glycosyltransferase family 4 protein [Leptospirales bacterium]